MIGYWDINYYYGKFVEATGFSIDKKVFIRAFELAYVDVKEYLARGRRRPRKDTIHDETVKRMIAWAKDNAFAKTAISPRDIVEYQLGYLMVNVEVSRLKLMEV